MVEHSRRSRGGMPHATLLALDQILNNAATLRHMSGGQVGVPLVIRMTTGAGRQPLPLRPAPRRGRVALADGRDGGSPAGGELKWVNS